MPFDCRKLRWPATGDVRDAVACDWFDRSFGCIITAADECSLDAGENTFERAGENTGGADCGAVCGDICGAFVREDAHE